ncbi:hydroxymethylbilane synthase [Siccirubricoccus phaeus]|uniref:hydroxymethylbilane synthase n=1 Tax=Siccirubricoccus phaeus TaxID=2595053 RepID=UPI001F02DA5F|nr:hydroxymethylbilane synthase [Siccirubricoccus phaeus]
MSQADPAPPSPGAGPPRPLRAGTRGSPLALWQARDFLARLRAQAPGIAAEETVIATAGDKVQDRRLAEIGGKGLFAKEIHEALLDGRIDCAVHSLKDLETELPPGLALACLLPREDCRDALVVNAACGVPAPEDPLACLPPGAVIGTASVRRQAQLLHRRPDLRCEVIRGNVQTRLGRVRAGDFAASFLAIAGLKRMGMEAEAAAVLPPEVMLPAAGQGIIGITIRAGDTALAAVLAAIEDAASRLTATAERAVLGALDGSCRTPIGAHAALLPGGRLALTALIARPDGSFLLQRSAEGLATDGEALGRELGLALRRDAPADILA